MLFPDGNPIDEQLRPAAAGGDTWFTVIGVVEDVLLDDFRRESPEPMVYLPGPSLSPAYVLKSTRADVLDPEVRAIIREVMPESPMYRIFMMERLAANVTASLSFTMLMVSLAALVALVLGAGAVWRALVRVRRRAQEIGVRMALALAGTSAVMLAVAMLASSLPALRASRMDPVVALRAQQG